MSISVTVTGETTISLTVSPETAVSVLASGGIGPAGFLTAPGTSTNAFGTFQVQAGPGVTISTTSGVFQIASYSTTEAASFSPVQSVAGRTGAVVLQAADITTGTLDIARIPTISYTALSNVPATFAPSAHTHGTADVVGLTAAAASAAPVQSVNGLTGAVTITRADLTAAAEVHTHSTADIISFTAAASAAAPVQSVAGRTGTISLAAADVSGLAAVATSGSYTSLSEIPVEFTPATHTHDAGDVVSGTLDVARMPTISYTALSNVPATFAPSAHTHSTSDVVGLTANFSQVGHTHDYAATTHTHDAADVTSGTLDFARLPAIGYTALAGVPTTFAPEAHTHSTADISGYSSLPSQSGANGPLVTDGTAATWASRYSVVDPVLVEGAGMTLSRDTAAGSITVAFAGGTSGVIVGSATPQPLGTAAAGTSADAAREDHVHQLPTVGDITAAAAVHTHAASDITSGTLDIARIPAIGYTALSGVPTSFTPASHTHDAAAIASGTLDIARIPTVSYTALSNVPVTFAPSAHTHSTADITDLAYPVSSVNGQTGVVSLAAVDVTAAAAVHTHTTSDITGYTLTTVNNTSGAVTIAAGANVTVSNSAGTITIAASSGGGGGSGGGVAMSYLFS